MFVTDAYGQETAPSAEGGHDAEAPADAGHAAGTEVPHEGAEGLFPPFDASTFPSQILWLAITFGLFYLFLKRVMPRLAASECVKTASPGYRRPADEGQPTLRSPPMSRNWPRPAPTPTRSASSPATTPAEAETRASRSRPASNRSSPRPRRVAKIKATAMQDVGSIAEETQRPSFRRSAEVRQAMSHGRQVGQELTPWTRPATVWVTVGLIFLHPRLPEGAGDDRERSMRAPPRFAPTSTRRVVCAKRRRRCSPSSSRSARTPSRKRPTSSPRPSARPSCCSPTPTRRPRTMSRAAP